MSRSHTYVVVAVYNEQQFISKVIQRVKQAGFQKIIIVDDCSTDRTSHILAQEKGILYARHIINRGAGAAIQTGNEIALSLGAHYIANIDGDGQHSPEDLPKALRTLIDEDLDIVIGSRYLDKKSTRAVPFIKKVVHFLGRLFSVMTSGIYLSDVHNSFKVMTAQTARRLDIQHDRFEFCSEVQDKLVTLRLKYKEVPTYVHYSRRNQLKSLNRPRNMITIAFRYIISKVL